MQNKRAFKTDVFGGSLYLLLFLNCNYFEIIVISLVEGLELCQHTFDRLLGITLCFALFECVDEALVLCLIRCNIACFIAVFIGPLNNNH